jgi:hypothetical protein
MSWKLDPRDIVIVSGLPRSGTSLMMQMLKAGGVPLLTDEQRAADVDKPQGYFEYELVKSTRENSQWLLKPALSRHPATAQPKPADLPTRMAGLRHPLSLNFLLTNRASCDMSNV